MITAEWNGKILARSDKTTVVEGNHYFPPEAVNNEFLVLSPAERGGHPDQGLRGFLEGRKDCRGVKAGPVQVVRASLFAELGIQSVLMREIESMERIVVYTDTLEIEKIASALPDYEILRAASTAELARAIVERSRVIALIIEKEVVDDRFQQLLASIKKSFPILQVCLIADSGADLAPAARVIPKNIATEDCDRFAEALKAFVSSIGLTERRDHPRFDWPLQGSLSFDDRNWRTYNLWALSAEGAFLESSGSVPLVGSRGILRISFQNSRLVTRCEVLDPRQASSKLPGGFAVRFTLISADSMKLIDRIIQDALLQTLLQPEIDPATPTLGEEDLSIPGFEPL